MRHGSPDLHILNLDFGEVLPVTGATPVAGAAREPEDADLVALAVAHHFGGHLGAPHQRLPRLHLLPVADEQDAVEGHSLPGLGREQRHLHGTAGLGLELLATGGENGVRHRAGTLIMPWGSCKAYGHTAHTAIRHYATAYCSVTSLPAGFAIIWDSSR